MLRDWASKELKGYAPDDVLPPYRTLHARVHFDGLTSTTRFTSQVIGIHDLPEPANEIVGEEVDIRDPVAALIGIAEGAREDGELGIHIGIPQSTVIVSMINERNREAGHPTKRVTDLYWQVHRTSLEAIVDVVRTTVVELVANLRPVYGGSDCQVSPASVDQAVSFVVYGKAKNVSINQNLATGEANIINDQGKAESMWHRLMWWIVGIATVAGAIATVIALK